jgi:LSD1 subclass zinc finger protein
MPETDQTPEHRCTHCPRLLRKDELHRQACRVCETRATEQVQALPALYRQLEAALQPGSTGGNAGRPAAGRTAPIPVVLQPLTLRGPGGIVSMLLGIEQRWRIQLDWGYLPLRGGYETTLDGTAAVIVNNLPWACDQYEGVAADLMLIGSLHAQATQAVTGERDVRVPVGACPVVNDDTGVGCGQPLKVSPWASSIRCTACGTSWQRDEWLHLGAVIRGLAAPVAA